MKAAEAAFPGRDAFLYAFRGLHADQDGGVSSITGWKRNEADYIESFDFYGSGWIKTGIQEERLIYRHWFNERQKEVAVLWLAEIAEERLRHGAEGAGGS